MSLLQPVASTSRSILPSFPSPIITQARFKSSSPYGHSHVLRHRERKLPSPIVPQFPQRVIRADGSSFTHWTTSPRSLLRLTRDLTNNPFWNVSLMTKEGAEEESAVTGRLGRFQRKFGEAEQSGVGVGNAGTEALEWMELQSAEATDGKNGKGSSKGKKA